LPVDKPEGGLRLPAILPEYQSMLATRFRDIAVDAPAVVIDCSSGVGGLHRRTR
jgi:hypothetical protein